MKKVFVGVSGGVDSAVSAALLKERGFNVVCVFIKIWQPEFLECNWKEERIDAMRVAVSLGLPFREIDLSEDYKREVIDSMIKAYSNGITPNPDVLCNRAIKFGSFLKYAKENGADFIATGHYARIGQGKRPACADPSACVHSQAEASADRQKTKGKSLELLRGVDKNKDQSYFLHMLGQNDLASAIFPIGDLTKTEVRDLARKFGLPVAGKPDSQGLCFVGDITLKDFLGRHIKLKKGDVLDMNGSTVGKHGGAALYTVGQRHGFLITNRSMNTVPHFVSAVDAHANTITVSANIADAMKEKATVENMNWITVPPSGDFKAEVQARYREKPIKAQIRPDGDRAEVIFSEPHIVSAGQSLVVYDGEVCFGGGIIK